MGKRYYCDYCDRSFKDDTEARKKHLTSLQHARNRAEHYDRFKDPETILKEETAKTPCKRFMTHGDCAFGTGCRFSHYTPHMIWELEQCVFMQSRNNSGRDANIVTSSFPRSSEVIKEFFENANGDGYSVERNNHPDWNLPIELQNYSNLPPSLWPINPHDITDSNFGRWGK